MKKLYIVLLGILLLNFASAYLVYDEINDSSINTTLWVTGGTSTPVENTDYIQGTSSCGDTACSSDSNLTSIDIEPRYTGIENMTMRVSLSSTKGNSNPSNAADTNFNFMGHNIIGFTTTGSDDSVWTFVRNRSVSDNTFEVFDDGVHSQQINISGGKEINFYTLSEGSGGSSGSNTANFRVYYVYYNTDVEVRLIEPDNETMELYTTPVLFNATLLSTSSTLTNATLYLNGTANETVDVTGTTNFSSFTKTLGMSGNVDWFIEGCSASGVCANSTTRTLLMQSYLEDSLSYTAQTIEGTIESFMLDLSLVSGTTVSSATFTYNGTSYSPTITQGTGYANISSTIQIPSFASNVNVSFDFNVTLSDSTNFVTNATQEVLNINLDTCTSNTELLLNLSLFDERTLADINGTIEVNVDVLNTDRSLVDSISAEAINVHEQTFCTNLNISTSNYLYDAEIRYYSSNDNGTTFTYVPEFYHIQSGQAQNLPQQIDLYDLNTNESTEFTLRYRDNTYTARSNTLLSIQRKYINEGIFRTVEIPITSSEGEAISHFDLNNYKYRIIATQYGEVLNVFDNPTIECESELSGICIIELNGQGTPNPTQDLTQINDLSFSIEEDNGTITLDFIIPSGESKDVRAQMVQYSALADPNTLCNSSLVSSSGQFICSVDATIGDSVVKVELYVNGTLEARADVYYQEDLAPSFLLNNYVLGGLLLITLVGMSISAPVFMIVAVVFGVVLLGVMFLLKGSSIGLVLGAISWLIVAAIIAIIKIVKKSET